MMRLTVRSLQRRQLSSASTPTPSPAHALKDIVSLCKRRGFVFPGSDMYGGFANSFDYGPMGVLLKNNLRRMWWRDFVDKREGCHGLESSVIMSPRVWQASGHLDNFVDAMVECSSCHTRSRADHMLEEATGKEDCGTLSLDELESEMKANGLLDTCKSCGAKNTMTAPRQFNLLFETQVGPLKISKAEKKLAKKNAKDGNSAAAGANNSVYLRPETAQGAFVNYLNVRSTVSGGLPMGIGQLGKSFRNEVSPGNYIFRTREFEQAELQWFCKPDEANIWFDFWAKECFTWAKERIGLKAENVRIRHHEKDELAHYALATADIEYKYPFGWGEMWGIANRGDFDLNAHGKASGKNVMDKLTDPNSPPFVPFAIEPALGINRLFLAVICDAYTDEIETGRKVLRFHPSIAPYMFAVSSIAKDGGPLEAARDQVYALTSEWASVALDTKGTSVGKKYRKHDEIGTPYYIMVDSESLQAGMVSVRGRDSMKQVNIPIESFKNAGVLDDIKHIL